MEYLLQIVEYRTPVRVMSLWCYVLIPQHTGEVAYVKLKDGHVVAQRVQLHAGSPVYCVYMQVNQIEEKPYLITEQVN